MNLKPNISLSFNGQCEAAFGCYERCLGGTITYVLRWGDCPAAAEAPPEWSAKIYHATLKVGDTVFQGGDRPPGQYERPSGFSLILQMDDEAAAERIYEALAENARIQMPLQQTFWAKRFAALVDQFGIPWSINCE